MKTLFCVHVKVLIRGAATLFGVQTELLLNMTKERIQTQMVLQLFAIKCNISIFAGYPTAGKKSLSDASFVVKIELTTGMEEVGKQLFASETDKYVSTKLFYFYGEHT